MKYLDNSAKSLHVVDSEMANAYEAAEITNTLLKSSFQEKSTLLKRKEVSDILGITMDTLRNWETNGLLKKSAKKTAIVSTIMRILKS